MGTYKLARLYQADTSLSKAGDTVILESDQARKLSLVLRMKTGDKLRIFNGRDGEWLAEINEISKSGGTIKVLEQIQKQPNTRNPDMHLYFAPIKKPRLEWLIEKAVELGVNHLHPVITQNCENRKFKDDKLNQLIEGATIQCERLDLAQLHAPITWPEFLNLNESVQVALERSEKTQNLTAEIPNIMIGPEGGFTAQEKDDIENHPHHKPITLGNTILRAETAAIVAVAKIL